MGYLLNRAGYHSRHVPHGWRATFSTIMNERYRDDRYIIDLILAHAAKDKTESAYNRAAHLKRRGELLQEWADMLLRDANAAMTLAVGRRRAERPLPHRGDAIDAAQSLQDA
jgi:integrase